MAREVPANFPEKPMFIVWGKQHVYRQLGHVADFCPLCRQLRSFRLRRVGLAGHVYYISLGCGALVGHERVCDECGGIFASDPERYASTSKRKLPLDELQALTMPDFRSRYAERLALEKKVLRGGRTLSAEERAALIREPFLLTAPLVEERLASVRLDRRFWLALLGLFIFPALFTALMEFLLPDDKELGLMIAVGAVLAWVVWVIATAGRYYVRREIVPKLVRALGPLVPSDNEIDQELRLLKAAGRKLGKTLKLADLRRGIAAAQTADQGLNAGLN